MNDQLVVLGRRAQPRAQIRQLAAPMLVALEKVRDDANLALDRQRLIGVAPQAVGHRGHAVGLIDRKRHGLRVRRVAAEQRDVGAVKRRDDFRHLRIRSAVGRREDVLREIRGGRVRNGVVRVHDVERELARELHDLVRERQQVLRLAKQRIGRRMDAMEREPRFVVAEAERRLRADQMHLMAAASQRLRQLGGDDAAAANRRVTHHSDMHSHLFKQMCAHDRLVHDDALGKPHARQRAELRIAAFDELAEARGIKTRFGGFGCAGELAGVARERPPLGRRSARTRRRRTTPGRRR